MSTTIHDVANSAGVSIATVSRVLNNSGHPVNDKTRQRILDAAEELGYRPNHAARSLRTEQSLLIGIIADDITSPFTPLIIRGIQDYMHDAGYLCITVNTDWNPKTEVGAIRDLVSRSIDGMIFVETWHREANEAVEIANKPYAFVHRQFAAAHPNSITPDEVYGAQLAVNHLIQLGHRRIGFITGPEEYYASHDRLQGYQIELARASIPLDVDLVTVADWETSGGYAATQELLQLWPNGIGRITPMDQIYTVWSRILAVARPTCTRDGLSLSNRWSWQQTTMELQS